MNRCPKCGSLILPEDKFCGICGTRIVHEELRSDFLEASKTTDNHRGVIMTDTYALASKFNVARNVVIDILKKYIDDISAHINYQLLDVYEQLQQETYMPVFSSNNSKDWKAYHKILYRNGLVRFREKTEYLFIIGGEDVIPMPNIPNVFEITDTVIPTDFVYAYSSVLYKDTMEIINSVSSQIINYHVGRLPLGTDADISILKNYLERASKVVKDGIPIQMSYAQCDPTWKRVSKKTMSILDREGLIPNIKIDPFLCYENYFLSPYITVETVDNVFNPYANLFYFNLHGSNKQDTPCFLGRDINEDPDKFYPAISPTSFCNSKFDNIIVTEACYGGKFIDLPTDGSMLLTALANKTLIYLGSSVVAMGCNDPQDENEEPSTCCADVIAKEFVASLMEGKTAGEALTRSRYVLYNSSNKSQLLTMLEFSLYGDPSLKAKFPDSIKAKINPEPTPSKLSEKGGEILSTDIVYSNKADSILSFVRQRVDLRFEEINSEIQHYLSGYGVKPRKLTTIRRVRNGQNTQHWYSYDTDIYGTVMVVVESDNKKTALFPKQRTVRDRLMAGRNISINYAAIFRKMSRRFGLIDAASIKLDEKIYLYSLTTWRDKYGMEDLCIDGRIEDESKLQVDTFNAILDESYRKRMSNNDIPGLSVKSSVNTIDFSALINPLSIIIETELRNSIILFLKRTRRLDVSKFRNPKKPMYREIVEAMKDNMDTMRRLNISESFIKLIADNRDYRNQAAHEGGIEEEDFMIFYDRFGKFISDKSFGRLMEIKKHNNKNRNNYE